MSRNYFMHFLAIGAFLSISSGVFALATLGTDFVGTTTNSDFLFQINNVERMRLDTSGNLGIGTTSPNRKLDVYTATNNGDGIAIGQDADNSQTIQTYIDATAGGGWANRATYAGGCCNTLKLQPDVGNVTVGAGGLSVAGGFSSASAAISGNISAATFNSLAINTSLTNNLANQIVRTDGNGYANFGWINTTSGDNGTAAISRIYASSDNYIRTYTPANFISTLGLISTGNIGSQSVNYANTSGAANSVVWGNVTGRPGWLSGGSYVETASDANAWRNSGFYENGGGGSNWPSATWYNSINVRHSNQGNYHGFQVAMSYYDNLLWFRSYNGAGTFQPWVYAISSGNIGSQSVNYANTAGSATTAGSISGYNNPTTAATANTIVYRDAGGHTYANYSFASYFNAAAGNSENPTIGQIWTQNTTDDYLRKSTPAHFISQLGLMDLTSTQYPTGVKMFQSNKGASSYVGSNTNSSYALQAFSSDQGAAGMSFHRGGYYAVNFGLDPDNVLRIGGWSAAANRWELDMAGNQSVAGSLTSWAGVRALGGSAFNSSNGYSFTTNDTDGGMFSPADGTLVFATNNAERMRIDSNANVGIGMLPSYRLDVNGDARTLGNNIINNGGPIMYFQDTDNRSSMIHVNSNQFYIMRGAGNNSTSWATYGSYWPLQIDLENNNALFGGNINVPVGNATIQGTNIVNDAIEIGQNRTGDRWSYLDLHTDDTYTDYSLRLLKSPGANGDSQLSHRGAGGLYINTIDSAPLLFQTSNIERMRLGANGGISIGSGTIYDDTKLFLESTSTNTSLGANSFGIVTGNTTILNVNPSANTGLSYGGLTGLARITNGNTRDFSNLSTIAGIVGQTDHGGSGYQGREMFGVLGSAGLSSNGSANSLHGVRSHVVTNTTSTTATVNSLQGFHAYVDGIGPGGNIGEAAAYYGYIRMSNNRLPTTSVGLMLGPIRGVTSWAIYSEDFTAHTYLAGAVGIGTLDHGYNAGYLFTVNGYARAYGWYGYSDIALKKNLAPVKNPLEKIQSLTGYTFNWKKDDKASMGVIAQEVEKVFPDIVTKSTNGSGETIRSVDYGALTAPLIESVKTLANEDTRQEEKIKALEAQNATLQKQYKELESQNEKLSRDIEEIKSMLKK